jgi:hypothetical protein
MSDKKATKAAKVDKEEDLKSWIENFDEQKFSESVSGNIAYALNTLSGWIKRFVCFLLVFFPKNLQGLFAFATGAFVLFATDLYSFLAVYGFLYPAKLGKLVYDFHKSSKKSWKRSTLKFVWENYPCVGSKCLRSKAANITRIMAIFVVSFSYESTCANEKNTNKVTLVHDVFGKRVVEEVCTIFKGH